MRLVRTAALLLCWGCAACSDPMPVSRFAGDGPAFDPVSFWTGHVQSWGVLENRSGEPDMVVTTDCVGEAEGDGGLHMRQTLRLGDGTVQSRDWHMRRTGAGRFEATANDMVGTAVGEAAGRAFHWSWVLATKPGDSLRDVTMDQWMYGLDDGTMMNRTTIRKLGIILAEVSEDFHRTP